MSTLTVAALQFDIDWLAVEQNLAAIEKFTDGLQDIDLLLLPEAFATGFSIDIAGCEMPESGGAILAWMKAQAKRLNCVIAGSVLVACQSKKANRLYWVWPDGRTQYYDKRHLFRMGDEQAFVVAGQKRLVIEINGVKILPQVCYDLRFPVWARNQQDYDVMINVANWPAVRRSAWDTLLKARAIENQCFVIGVNRIGRDGKSVEHDGGTSLIGFSGELLAQVADNTPGLLIETLDIDSLMAFKAKFPAHLDADPFQLL